MESSKLPKIAKTIVGVPTPEFGTPASVAGILTLGVGDGLGEAVGVGEIVGFAVGDGLGLGEAVGAGVGVGGCVGVIVADGVDSKAGSSSAAKTVKF